MRQVDVEGTDAVREAGRLAAERAPAAPATTGEALAPLLALQRSAGNAAVAARLSVQRRAGQALRGDALYEQMAHNWAYEDGPLSPEATAVLQASGYQAEPTQHGPMDFQLRVFLPQASGIPAVVAFRGTESLADVLVDADPAGIGLAQYVTNVGLIEGVLRRADRLGGGQLLVTGHSLGGALAQIAASYHLGLVDQVVTFQSAGVNADRIMAVAAWNRSHPPDQRLGVRHHRVRGDVVPSAGDGHLPGEATEYTTSEWGPIDAHTEFPLAGLAGRGGAGDPGVEGSTGRIGVASRGAQAPPRPNVVEGLRRGVGVRAGGPAVVVAGALQHAFAAVWSDVTTMLTAGADDGTILAYVGTVNGALVPLVRSQLADARAQMRRP